MISDFKTITVTKHKKMFLITTNDESFFLRFNTNRIFIISDYYSDCYRQLEYTFNNTNNYYNHLSIGYFFCCSINDKKRIVEYEKQIQEFSYHFIGV